MNRPTNPRERLIATLRLFGQSRHLQSTGGRWFAIFLPVAAIYLLTGNYGPYVFIDAAAAFHPAWHLVHHGHLWVDDAPLRIWMFVPDDSGHLVSNRPVGLLMFAVPFYAVLSLTSDGPTALPSVVAASLATAVGVANLGLLFESVVSRRAARYGAYLAAFGTSLWSVAAAEYLPHGLDVMWLTSALLALRGRRDVLAGVLLAAAITTRPHLAIVAMMLGVGAAYHHRFRSLLAVGVPSTLGLLVVMTYNSRVFGSFNIRGGYSEYVDAPLSSQVLTGIGSTAYLENMAGALVSGSRGILVLSPFLILLLPGLRRAWPNGPWWMRWSAVAGCAYMLVQMRIQSGTEGFLGGGLIFAYRYPIEFLCLMGPLLAASWQAWTSLTPRRRKSFIAVGLLSIWIHAIGALLYDIMAGYPYHAWFAWAPAVVLFEQAWPVTAVATVVVAVSIAAALAYQGKKDDQPDSRSSSMAPEASPEVH